MLRNYLIVTFRNLYRHKGFTLINITGLSIGMAISILIYIWVDHELSYNKFNSKYNSLYKLAQTQYYTSGPLTTVCMPGPVARDIRDEFPEIVNSFMYYEISATVNYQDIAFTENIRLADPQLFEMFDFEFISGSPETVFKHPEYAVITDKMAKKLFQNEDPVGKIISLNNEYQFKVNGVIRETPKNSSFRFDICIPFENIEEMGYTIDRYGWNSYYVYVELAENTDYHSVNKKIKTFLEEKSRNQELAEGNEEYESNIDLFLFPLKKIHLYSYRESRGQIQFIYIFSGIAIFIIIIACINFMNLSTAKSSRRAKEIAIRKSVGAGRVDLVRQFFGESMLISFLAMIVATLMVIILIPSFNLLVEKELAFNFSDPQLWLLLVGITILVGILAGSYPAIYLSAFDPVRMFKNGIGKRKGNFTLRRALVVFQFILSVGLIISTIVISRQLSYLMSSELGMDLNSVSLLTLRGSAHEKYEVIRSELLKNPNILEVTRANSIPFYIGSNSGGFEWQGKDTDDDIIVGFAFTDEGYYKTLGMNIIDGRSFSGKIQSDTAGVIINQKAANAFGMEKPVGKWITWGDDQKFKIIGVVEDFHHLPMQNGIDPLAMFYAPDRCRQMFIKTLPDKGRNIDNYIEHVWESNVAGFPYEPKNLDEIYHSVYDSETRLIQIIRYFAFLAIVISCMGLFALSAYTAEQRTKEIGIRKILGASTTGIVKLVTKEYIKWVLVANIIAWPIAWFAMNDWLSSYAFHTRLSPDIFGFSLFLSLFIALVTIAFQSVNSALKKPVDAVKYE